MNAPLSTEKRVDLIEHGEKAAKFYMERPGLFQPATAIDIYECIADLAREVKELREAVSALEQNHGS